MNKVKSIVCLISVAALTGCLDESSEDAQNNSTLPLFANLNQQLAVTQPVNPQAIPPINPTVNSPVNPPVNAPVNPPVNPPVNAPVNPPVNTGDYSLAGLWKSTCEPDFENDASQQLEYVISEQTISQSIVLFLADTTCTGSVYLTMNETATFTEPGEQTNISDGNAQHIDITYTGGSLTASPMFNQILAAEGTDLASIAAAEGIPGDINNLSIEEIGRTQAEVYTIYRIDARFDGGTDLRIGAEDASYTGDSIELRPIVLDEHARFEKQTQ